MILARFALALFILFSAHFSAAFSLEFLPQISNLNQFQSLAKKVNEDVFVKYLLQYSGEKTFFQNTKTFSMHQDFMKAQLAEYADLDSKHYEEILLDPKHKNISAGSLYLNSDMMSADNISQGMIGFTIYFKGKLDADEVLRVYEALKQNLKLYEGRLVFLFNDADEFQEFQPERQTLLEHGLASMRLLSFLGKAKGPEIYNEAQSFGYLKKISAKQLSDGEYNSKNILVLEKTPLDIEPTSGIISLQPQPPHSHIIVRTDNQGVPNLYLPRSQYELLVEGHIGQLVELSTMGGQLSLKGAKDFPGGEDELLGLAEQYFIDRKPKLPDLTPDLKPVRLLKWSRLTQLPPEMVNSYGAKATNFARMDRRLRSYGAQRSDYEKSFAVPFSFYDNHIKQNLSEALCYEANKSCQKASDNSNQICSSLLNSCLAATGQSLEKYINMSMTNEVRKELLECPEQRKLSLRFIRNLIKNIGVKPVDLKKIRKALKAYPSDRRMRLRSSTNVEDLPGVNGAGLYTSKSACLADELPGANSNAYSACLTKIELDRKLTRINELEASTDPANLLIAADERKSLGKKKALKKAIAGVYESVWNDKAFLDREFYGIDHSKVYMGLLVHPSYIDENANGVIFFKKAPSANRYVVDIVSQRDDISVTNPELAGAVSERIVVTIDAKGQVIDQEVRQLSNILMAPQRRVLANDEVTELVKQVWEVALEMSPNSELIALDIEFKLGPQREVLLKQVRPLPVDKVVEPQKATILLEQTGNENIPKVVCPADQSYEVLSLVKGELVVHPEDTGLKGVKSFDTAYFPSQGVIFEVCNKGDSELYLKQIVQRLPSAGAWSVFRYNLFQPREAAGDQGLGKAFFQKDYSDLYIEFADAVNSPNESYVLFGAKSKQDQDFLVLSGFDAQKGDPKEVYTFTSRGREQTRTVLYGSLTIGNMYINPWKDNDRVFEFGELKIRLVYQFRGVLGEYVDYSFAEISIEDKAKNISVRYMAEELKKNFTINYSHHGVLDSFEVRTPKVTYLIEKNGLSIISESETKKWPLSCTQITQCGEPAVTGGGPGGPPMSF